MQGRDQIDEAFRRMRRRSDMVVVILTASIVAIIAPLWIASPPPLEPYALANIAIFFFPPVIIFIGMRWGQRQLKRSLEMVRSRVREAGAFSFLYIVVILDNGLLLQLPGAFVAFSSFFSSDGSPLSPRLREALRWTSPFRWTRLVTIRAGKKTPELTVLRDALGAGMAAASVFRYKRRGVEIDSDLPAWVAHIALGRVIGPPIRVDRIVSEADRIAGYLQSLVQVTLSRARAVPARRP